MLQRGDGKDAEHRLLRRKVEVEDIYLPVLFVQLFNQHAKDLWCRLTFRGEGELLLFRVRLLHISLIRQILGADLAAHRLLPEAVCPRQRIGEWVCGVALEV